MRDIEFLVHGECECGWWCALPEMGMWPKCAECGEQVMPPRADGHPNDREGYVAVRLPEQEALEAVRRTQSVDIQIPWTSRS